MKVVSESSGSVPCIVCNDKINPDCLTCKGTGTAHATAQTIEFDSMTDKNAFVRKVIEQYANSNYGKKLND